MFYTLFLPILVWNIFLQLFLFMLNIFHYDIFGILNKLVNTLIVCFISLISFPIYYYTLTGEIGFNVVVVFYTIITLCLFLIRIMLDIDLFAKFDKIFNLTIIIILSTFLYLIWFWIFLI